jgi:hypothetical protein
VTGAAVAGGAIDHGAGVADKVKVEVTRATPEGAGKVSLWTTPEMQAAIAGSTPVALVVVGAPDSPSSIDSTS